MAEDEARHEWTRRHFLATTGGAAAVAAVLPTFSAAPAARATPLTTSEAAIAALRTAWKELLTGGSYDTTDSDLAAAVARLDSDVADHVALVDRTAGRDRVFTDLPLTAGDRTASSWMRDTFQRLERMATAFSTIGSAHEGDPDVLADVLAGLETANVEIYNDTQEPFGSWFHLKISGPHALGNTCVLLYDNIPAEALSRYAAAIDHFVPTPNMTGANRVNVCQSVLVSGVISDNTARIQTARDALAPVFQFVTSADGYYEDGSFIQHLDVAYTGSYGIELLGGRDNLGISKQMALLAGTPWELTSAHQQFVFDTVDHTYAPMVYDGQMLDLVRGRAISRFNQRGHDRARLVMESMLRLADAADASTAQRWRGMCKGWLYRHTYESPFIDGKVPQVALFKQLLADGSVASTGEPDGHSLFPGMARAVHRRPGWALGISMSSKRVAYYESMNAENLKGWHTGDGMTYLYNSDNAQYSDNFWPTVDLYRLPGTTIDTVPLPQYSIGAPAPVQASWAGGAVFEEELAAVGQDLEARKSPLRAKKSWMCFKNLVVAFGAGITGSEPNHRVETVVENRNLGPDGTNALTIDGVTQPGSLGWTFSGTATWAHLQGVGGYIFPGGATLHALREERTGAWADIGNLHGTAPTDPITRRYVTMWLDHGVQPDSAGYTYILLPGATPAQTAQRAQNMKLDTITNTSDLQAVRGAYRDVLLANRWSAGSIGDLTVDAGCSLVVLGVEQQGASPLTVALSDPTQELASVSVDVAISGFGSFSADDTVTVNSLGASANFTVDTAGSLGTTHTVTFYPA
ncbi:polysaccharide lyase 8 family protein [Ruania alba]|uniref:Hyaluronate lyase n=1 Tax=Ruania alba TaxID=648782 RepID=A0A1H5HI99_9MICO|nr:polysaccharide lyase 8 family protein [Ruania alba]SEE27759.1 hyaluronate lyase [Ruania alba]